MGETGEATAEGEWVERFYRGVVAWSLSSEMTVLPSRFFHFLFSSGSPLFVSVHRNYFKGIIINTKEPHAASAPRNG